MLTAVDATEANKLKLLFVVGEFPLFGTSAGSFGFIRGSTVVIVVVGVVCY